MIHVIVGKQRGECINIRLRPSVWLRKQKRLVWCAIRHMRSTAKSVVRSHVCSGSKADIRSAPRDVRQNSAPAGANNNHRFREKFVIVLIAVGYAQFFKSYAARSPTYLLRPSVPCFVLGHLSFRWITLEAKRETGELRGSSAPACSVGKPFHVEAATTSRSRFAVKLFVE